MHETMARFIGEQGYLDVMRRILKKGARTSNRTKINTASLFVAHNSYDLNGSLPLLTTKFVPIKPIAVELEWFISGSSNIRFLEQNNCKIWTEWPFKSYLIATGYDPDQISKYDWDDRLKEFRAQIIEDEDFALEHGSIGEGAYGPMWRKWPGQNGKAIDQLNQVVEKLNSQPNDRRNLVVAYNPALVDQALLPPCHSFFQFYVDDEQGLVCTMTQRSADYFLGVPFNIASYSMLTYILASITGLTARAFEHVTNNTHLYLNHEDQANLQLSREPYIAPNFQIPSLSRLEDFKWQMAVAGLSKYDHHSKIKGEVAV